MDAETTTKYRGDLAITAPVLAMTLPEVTKHYEDCAAAYTSALRGDVLALPPDPMAALTVICPDCEDGVRWESRWAGNDPDVLCVGPCETCGGDGVVPLCCDGCSDPEAVEWFAGFKWCQTCAAEQKADALVCGEDVL